MHRIDGPGATTDHQFTDGDPVGSVPATVVTDEWLNAVQEEISEVIESTGAELNKDLSNQLLTAINKKILDAGTSWEEITGKPTTLGGYGITNGLTSGNNDAVPSFYHGAPATGGSASINLREVGLGTDTNLDPTYAPCLGFLWSGVVYGRMSMRTDGQPYWNGSPMLTNNNIDPWAMQPVGALIALLDNNSVPAPPRDNPAYRYIRLTASDSYNTGIVTSESVAGTAPMVTATGVISLVGSPLNGLRINLINTERRFLRAGLPGVIEQDAFQGHSLGDPRLGNGYILSTPSNTNISYTTGADTGTVVTRLDVNATGVQLSVKTDGTNGVPRLGNETRVKSMGATYYMRVR